MNKPFYITTTLPYVNAAPHIGFALEIVQADTIARYKRLTGYDVFFNFGSDEHGQKILQNALDQGKDTQKYVDEYAVKFVDLKSHLNLTYDAFIRTTDPHHKAAAQEMWRRCKSTGDIYKKNYEIRYCVGCELEKTDSELVDDRCPLHPNIDLDTRDEENYFFRLSKYQEKLQELYSRTDFVIPDYRLNEMRSFTERKGLEDFSISRLKAKMPWGVEVPDDAEHVMYVWFDALVNYISTLGWPTDTAKFERFWNGTQDCVQMAGKDQVRQQATMWQAMLMSAGLPQTGQIVIHGFITSDGKKMSKSLGNVVEPMSIVEEYGTDAIRYFLLRHIHPTEDSDFTIEKFKEVYNADLANGLGNQTARIMKLAEDNLDAPVVLSDESRQLQKPFCEFLDRYDYNGAVCLIWEHIAKADAFIQEKKPFSLVKSDDTREEGKQIIAKLVQHLAMIAMHLKPITPATSEKIMTAIKNNKKPDNLFAKKD